jgi:hypothetical protein
VLKIIEQGLSLFDGLFVASCSVLSICAFANRRKLGHTKLGEETAKIGTGILSAGTVPHNGCTGIAITAITGGVHLVYIRRRRMKQQNLTCSSTGPEGATRDDILEGLRRGLLRRSGAWLKIQVPVGTLLHTAIKAVVVRSVDRYRNSKQLTQPPQYSGDGNTNNELHNKIQTGVLSTVART